MVVFPRRMQKAQKRLHFSFLLFYVDLKALLKSKIKRGCLKMQPVGISGRHARVQQSASDWSHVNACPKKLQN